MSSLFDSHGRIGPGGFAGRVVVILLLWAGLVVGALHYVGQVWPREFQLAAFAADERVAEQERALQDANKPATPAPSAAVTPAAATASPAAPPATTNQQPATSNLQPATAPAAPAKPAAKAPVPPPEYLLAGYDREAFPNVSIFLSIVISIYALATLLTQVIQRLRDLGWRTTWSVLTLVPAVNVLLLLALMFLPGHASAATSHPDAH